MALPLSYTLALTSVSLAFPLEENSKKEVESNLVLVITYIKVVKKGNFLLLLLKYSTTMPWQCLYTASYRTTMPWQCLYVASSTLSWNSYLYSVIFALVSLLLWKWDFKLIQMIFLGKLKMGNKTVSQSWGDCHIYGIMNSKMSLVISIVDLRCSDLYLTLN